MIDCIPKISNVPEKRCDGSGRTPLAYAEPALHPGMPSVLALKWDWSNQTWPGGFGNGIRFSTLHLQPRRPWGIIMRAFNADDSNIFKKFQKELIKMIKTKTEVCGSKSKAAKSCLFQEECTRMLLESSAVWKLSEFWTKMWLTSSVHRSRRSFVALVADRNRMAVMPSVLCSGSMNSCTFKSNFKRHSWHVDFNHFSNQM